MSHDPEKKNEDANAFMSSMTFATPGAVQRRQCDCDECGLIPLDLLAAIRKRKRQRLECMPLRRTQDRRLIIRDEGLSLWSLTMPIHAEPMIEFGSSDRLVWVKLLPESSIVKSIGTGIIGSSDEQNSRTSLDDWKEGVCCLIPSNGGKAVGWVNTVAKPDTNTSEDVDATAKTSNSSYDGGYAVLYVLKIPKFEEILNSTLPPEDSSETRDKSSVPSLVEVIRSLCPEIQDLRGHADSATANSTKKKTYHILSNEGCTKLKGALKKIIHANEIN